MARQTLPGILADIEAVAGRQAALEFAREWGGAKIYVPTSVFRAQWLNALPKEVGPKLAREWGGLYVCVPTMGYLFPRRVASQIKNDLAAGYSVSSIAKRQRVSIRHVQRIKRRS